MNEKKDTQEQKLPEYEAPQITTYTDDELLEELGPAQTFYNTIDDILPDSF